MKRIVDYRLSDKGLIVDFADQVAAASVNARTGDILLDEGSGEDRVSGAAILLSDNPELKHVLSNDSAIQVEYGSEKRFQHLLGVATSAELAHKIVAHANSLIEMCRLETISKAKVRQEVGIELTDAILRNELKENAIVKVITNFRQDARGMYLDLADQPCAIALNRRTRDILLDEGGGPDRYHGIAIFLDSKPCFTLESIGSRRGLWLIFGEERNKHFLGSPRNVHDAVKWVTEANLLLGQTTRYSSRCRAIRGSTNRVTASHDKPLQVVLRGTVCEIDGGPSKKRQRFHFQKITHIRFSDDTNATAQVSLEGCGQSEPAFIFVKWGPVRHRLGTRDTITRT